MLEPLHRGGSNEYPQSMFCTKNDKNRYTHVYPSFTIYQRTNGPVNAHLSLLHIPITCLNIMVFNPSAGADEALGSFSFFRIINIRSMDASRQVSLKSIYWFQRRRYLKGFYHIWAWWPSWSCDLDY